MNEIVNKFLLAGDKCIPEMHLRQLAFTYSACGPFTKNKERIQNGIGFDRRSRFSFTGGGFGQNVLVFGATMSTSIHIDNKGKRHISIWKRTNAKIREYFNCRKKCIQLTLQ